MKQIHIPSALIGAVIIALFGVLLGAQVMPLRADFDQFNPLGTLKVEVAGIPAPDSVVNLAEGTPYTVPAGKILIITDWVTTDVQTAENKSSEQWSLIRPRIRINGVDVWGGGFSSAVYWPSGGPAMTSSGTATLTGSLRSGVRANAGDIVTLETTTSPSFNYDGNPTTFASGYLADA